MAIRDCVELDFAENPSRLLRELGLQTKQFESIKTNILTRLISRPELEIIVLEFRRGGLYYGEVFYGDTERYKQAQASRSHSARSTRRRDSDRPTEPEIDRDDGDSDSEGDGGWSLESLLRRQFGKK